MENTIFYTFSTIAQLLATVMAIVTSFVFFLIQNNRDRLGGLAQNFYDLMVGRTSNPYFADRLGRELGNECIINFRRSMISRDYKKIEELMDSILTNANDKKLIPEPIEWRFLDFKGNFNALSALQIKIKTWTWTTLIYTSGFILFSVVVLSNATCISDQSSVILIIAAIALLSLNIFLYLRLIKLLF